MTIARRGFIAGVATLAGTTMLPRALAAAPAQEPRLLVVNLRGAVDGLAAVMPVGDPHFAPLRTAMDVPVKPGGPPPKPGLPLDGMFQLNGNLVALHDMYRAGEALFFHAVATPYRSRSHFDAQMVLESGFAVPQGDGTGWLNRAILAMDAPAPRAHAALAVYPTIPLILRGKAPVESWQPQVLTSVSADLAARLLTVYEARDPALAAALRKGVDIDTFLAEDVAIDGRPAGGKSRFAGTMEAVGKLMASPEGPRVAAINIDGWDTHASQGSADGRLGKQFSALDRGLAVLKQQMGALWPITTVVVVTEFGRTARANGSFGTDHGTGGIAMLIGGRVRGGRVIADWPSLADAALFEGRDLAPTLDLRAVLKGTLAETLGLGTGPLDTQVFPNSRSIRPLTGLLRA